MKCQISGTIHLSFQERGSISHKQNVNKANVHGWSVPLQIFALTLQLKLVKTVRITVPGFDPFYHSAHSTTVAVP